MTVRVALIGCGAWGQNLLRTLAESPRASVVAVADTNPSRLARARQIAPGSAFFSSFDGALEARPDAVVIATPSVTHAAITISALEAGVDVFVEKPLALTPQDADRCALKAASLGRVAMVGHLLRYHPAVVRMIALARERRLGELRHFASSRLRSGGDYTSSIVWSLGPHDISILRALDPSPITAMEAQWSDEGGRVVLDVELESGVTARIELARANPTKERRISITGASKSALFDDVRAPDRVVLGASPLGLLGAGVPRDPAAQTEAVCIDWREPLALELDHFLDCVERRTSPLTSFEEGASVVRVLARVEAMSPRRHAAAPLDAE